MKESETKDRDYTILYRDLSSKIAVMAPHGGGIEPGTIDIADALAGCEYTFYGFKGLKKEGNSSLHLNSNSFDEPIGAKIAGEADIVIAIHGANDSSEMVHIGGANRELKQVAMQTLTSAGFHAAICERPGLRGIKPDNICNRCKTKKGIQLEISRGLREKLFDHLTHRSLRKKTILFYRFISSLKKAIEQF